MNLQFLATPLGPIAALWMGQELVALLDSADTIADILARVRIHLNDRHGREN